MLCINCKKEIEDGKFCPYCGVKQEQNSNILNTIKAETSAFKDNVTNESRKAVISKRIVIAVAVGSIIFLCIALCFGKSKSEKFLDMLRNGETEQASVYYQSKLASDKKELQKAYEEVVGEIELLVSNYASDEIAYDDAKNKLDLYSSFYSSEIENALQKIDALKKSKDAFLLAEEKFIQEEYHEAYDEYSKVIAEDINSEVAEKKKGECYDIIKNKAFLQGDENAIKGDYSLAINAIQKEIAFLKEEDKELANKKISEYIETYLDKEMTTFDASLKNEEYDECFQLLEDMVVVVSNDNKRIEDAEAMLYTSYEKHISENFDLSLKKLDLEMCENIIQEGMHLLPNSEVFLGLKSKLQEYYPVDLFEIEPFQESTYFSSNAQAIVDNQGDEHQLAYTCGGIYIKHADWKLGEKYNMLTGMVGVPSGDYDTGVNGEIILYGDGNVLWEKKGIDAATAPEYITIDVTGVDVLQIYMEGGSAPLSFCSVMVADFVVQKTQ